MFFMMGPSVIRCWCRYFTRATLLVSVICLVPMSHPQPILLPGPSAGVQSSLIEEDTQFVLIVAKINHLKMWPFTAQWKVLPFIGITSSSWNVWKNNDFLQILLISFLRNYLAKTPIVLRTLPPREKREGIVHADFKSVINLIPSWNINL